MRISKRPIFCPSAKSAALIAKQFASASRWESPHSSNRMEDSAADSYGGSRAIGSRFRFHPGLRPWRRSARLPPVPLPA
jgi:hypothetical protein